MTTPLPRILLQFNSELSLQARLISNFETEPKLTSQSAKESVDWTTPTSFFLRIRSHLSLMACVSNVANQVELKLTFYDLHLWRYQWRGVLSFSFLSCNIGCSEATSAVVTSAAGRNLLTCFLAFLLITPRSWQLFISFARLPSLLQSFIKGQRLPSTHFSTFRANRVEILQLASAKQINHCFSRWNKRSIAIICSISVSRPVEEEPASGIWGVELRALRNENGQKKQALDLEYCCFRLAFLSLSSDFAIRPGPTKPGQTVLINWKKKHQVSCLPWTVRAWTEQDRTGLDRWAGQCFVILGRCLFETGAWKQGLRLGLAKPGHSLGSRLGL